MPDISDTLKADSTQLNAVDFTGPRTYTVESVRVVKGEQPVNIKVAEDEDGREYRPSKSMRRVLAACWGPDSDAWTGRRMTLYCDPSVKWAGKEVGGIKISRLSHITEPRKVMVQESSTVRRPHTVEPLVDEAPAPKATKPKEPTAKQVADCTDLETLRNWWKSTSEGSERREQIESRVAEIQAAGAE